MIILNKSHCFPILRASLALIHVHNGISSTVIKLMLCSTWNYCVALGITVLRKVF